jgi:hypothetical protein
MRGSVSVLAAVLVSIPGGIAGSGPRRVALGERFVLEIGDSVEVASELLQIGLENVTADSRCPKGEQCIREGEATVQLWLRKAGEAKETRELRSSSRDEGGSIYLGDEVKLLRLDPYPVSGRAIERGDYRATLEVTHGSADTPDR